MQKRDKKLIIKRLKDGFCCIKKAQKRFNFLEHRKRKSWKRKTDAALQETVGRKTTASRQRCKRAMENIFEKKTITNFSLITFLQYFCSL
ncbi:hypothetical protein CLI69_03250 [Prevotella intermedia]|nr:hypothetical protein CLI69_03250 [Prevotella intermedia]